MSEEFTGEESEGVKSLRAALAKRDKEMAELLESNTKLLKKDRTRGIADKLSELGAKPGLAEFVPESVEPENLGAWLAEKADLLGFKVNEPAAVNPANDAEAAAQQRISGFSMQLAGDSPDDPDLAAVLNAKTNQELDYLIYARKAGSR